MNIKKLFFLLFVAMNTHLLSNNEIETLTEIINSIVDDINNTRKSESLTPTDIKKKNSRIRKRKDELYIKPSEQEITTSGYESGSSGSESGDLLQDILDITAWHYDSPNAKRYKLNNGTIRRQKQKNSEIVDFEDLWNQTESKAIPSEWDDSDTEIEIQI